MNESITTPDSNRVHWSLDDVQHIIEENRVVIFSKGTPDNPGGGHSESTFEVMAEIDTQFELVDVSQERSISAALRAYSGRITLPMVYVDGKLVADASVLEDRSEGKLGLRSRIERAIS